MANFPDSHPLQAVPQSGPLEATPEAVASSALIWLRKKTLAGFASVVLIGVLGWVKFYAAPTIGEAYVESLRDRYRADISVGSWQVTLFPPRVLARDVVWRNGGEFSTNKLLTIDRVDMKVGLGSLLGFNRTFIDGLEHATLRGVALTLERGLTGEWNWQHALSRRAVTADVNRLFPELGSKPLGPIIPTSHHGVASDESGAVAKDFDIRQIEIRDMKLVWIEEMNANSGNGRIQRLRSELHVDDGYLKLDDIVGLVQDPGAALPVQVQFRGRTADGLIRAAGYINPFIWGAQAGEPRDSGWAPYIEDFKISLENVDASTIADMVPDALIRPKGGKLTGTIGLKMGLSGILDYDVRMAYADVAWSVNEQSPLYEARQGPKVIAALKGLRTTGDYMTSSRGQIRSEQFRLMPSISTSMTSAALAEAPRVVRGYAAVNQVRFEDPQLSPVAQQLNQIAAAVGIAASAVDTASKAADTASRAANTAERLRRSFEGAGRRLRGLLP